VENQSRYIQNPGTDESKCVARSFTYPSTTYLGMAIRRANSTRRGSQCEEVTQNVVNRHDDAHGKHSHSIFQSHSHDEHDHGHDAGQIVQALQTAGKL
jgi:hypothetical protein